MTLQELRDLVARLEGELTTGATEIRSLADTENISPEDESKLDGLLEARTAKKAELEQAKTDLATAEKRAADIEEAVGGATQSHAGIPDFQQQRKVDTGRDPGSLSREETMDVALKIIEERGQSLSSDAQDHVDHLLRSQNKDLSGSVIAKLACYTENDHYRSAFRKAMIERQPVFTPEEQRAVNAYRSEFRAMNEGTGADGGFGIPILIDPTIIISSGALDSPVLKICTIKTITTDAWKGVTAPGATWQYTAEAAVVTDGSPTMAQPNIPVYKADGWLPYSVEVEQDYPGFAEEMSKLLAQGYTDLLAVTLCTGSGSNQPTGVFTAMQNTTTNPAHVLVTTPGTLAAIDVRNAYKSVPELFRGKSTWLMNVEVQNLIQAFGNNLALADFSTNIASDGTQILEGKPVVITDYAPQFTNTTGTESVCVVGDFSAYYFIQRAGMVVELVDHIFDQATARPTGQRGWYAWSRNGANVVNPNALRVLSNS